MSKVNIGFCPACQDHIDAPASLLGIADTLMRAHLEVCEPVDTMAYVLVTEIEAALSKRCDYYTAASASGFRYRCQRYACDGFHLVGEETS